MKNNTKTYILIVAVLGVWGTIGYKIINGINPYSPETPQQEFSVAFNPKTKTETDTFSIQKVDKDPFLGTLASKYISVATNSKPKPKQIENTPSITYSGLVKKQNASNQVFVVTINNKQYLLKQGQIADSVTLIKGNTKAITVSYKNKSQTINRN